MQIKHLSDIALNFDAMLIDQFGVIHDGQKLYPGALSVLEQLHDRKIPVVVMTNSGKRADLNIARLLKIGLARNLFVDAISSGEVAYASIAGKRAYLIGKRGEEYGFDGVEFVPSLAEAEIILVLGSNAPETSIAEYEVLLRSTRLPMVCCNPDMLMMTPQGLQPAPGAIAKTYAQLGGEITWIGKPYPEIYCAAMNLLGWPKRVLCIGDSAEHDVAGGKLADLTTLLVLTGISEGREIRTMVPQPDYWMSDFT